jgi:molecular chaperone GrpE (heat shock protein)
MKEGIPSNSNNEQINLVWLKTMAQQAKDFLQEKLAKEVSQEKKAVYEGIVNDCMKSLDDLEEDTRVRIEEAEKIESKIVRGPLLQSIQNQYTMMRDHYLSTIKRFS